jgi:hypothetical protein
MDPLIGAALISAGGGLAGALFGGKDEYKMSPEQRRIYRMLLKEYEGGDFGYSRTERDAMKEQLRTGLLDESQAATGRTIASAGRRGLKLNPGDLTRVQAATNTAYGKGLTSLESGFGQARLSDKASLRSALLGSSQGDFVQADDSIFGDIGQAGGNWMQYYLLKDLMKKKGQNQKPIYGEGNIWS